MALASPRRAYPKKEESGHRTLGTISPEKKEWNALRVVSSMIVGSPAYIAGVVIQAPDDVAKGNCCSQT